MNPPIQTWPRDLPVVYRDRALVVVDKPSGLLVHPSAEASDRETCLSVLRRQIGEFVYPLHRLDRGTSGLLMFGLDRETARLMHSAFAERRIAKRYMAVVRGWITEPVTYDRPIGRGEGVGADAETRVRPLATGRLDIPVGRYPEARYSLVEAEPLTGRRHQIRRHLANNDHPIVGDTVHGDGRHNRLFRGVFNIHHLLLHASRLRFRHPYEEDREISLSVPLPPDFLEVVQRFGWEEGVRSALPEGTDDRP